MSDEARRLAERSREIAAQTGPGRAQPGPGRSAAQPAREQHPPGRSAARPGPEGGRAAWPRVGLVLAGGGAKGAYQVGAVQALADLGLAVAAIGGASIGALNGAVLACSPDLGGGAEKLAQMWREVARTAGPAGPPESWRASLPLPDQLRLLARNSRSAVLDPDFVAGLIRRHVDPARLAAGPPLWVTASANADLDLVTRQLGWLLDVLIAAIERQAMWFCVNELPAAHMVDALLASAALPLVFDPRQVDSHRYRDGALMDNVPVAPLVANCRCDLIVVIHLGTGEGFEARRYQGADVFEIRPRRSLDPPGTLGSINSLLDFSPARVEDLIAEGHQDARDLVRLFAASLVSSRRHRDSTQAVLDVLSDLNL